jgi:hypothetical protein
MPLNIRSAGEYHFTTQSEREFLQRRFAAFDVPGVNVLPASPFTQTDRLQSSYASQ